MAEGLRADAPDPGVAILGGDDAALALVLDRRQFELFAQDVRELVEGDVDFEHVISGVLAGLPRAVFTLGLLATDGIAGLSLTLTDTTLLLVPEGKARDVDLRDWNRDQILALAPEHFALRNVAAQVLANLAANDVAEP